MNKFIEFEHDITNEYGIQNVKLYLHDECNREIDSLMVNESNKKNFFTKILFNLRMLSTQGTKAIGTKNLELLTKSDGVCSMKIKTTKPPIRVLFKYEKDEMGALLLIIANVAFKEDGKKIHKDSYDKNIEICNMRMLDWRGLE